MRERRERKMQNFISFLMAIIIFENFQNFSLGIIKSLSKCPFEGQSSLVGYAQSSVPGELTGTIVGKFSGYESDRATATEKLIQSTI